MKARRRGRIALPIVAAALIGSALGVPGASSQTSPTLPDLNADQLLALAGVEAPPAGVSLELHMDFPVHNPLELGGVAFNAITAVVHPDHSVDMQSAVTASGDGPTAEADECTDQAFLPTGRKWDAADLPVKWEFRTTSTPDENSRLKTVTSLKKAHQIWPQEITRCDGNHDVNFGYRYMGRTSRGIKYDHHNVVDFGPLGGGALAINYTWFTGTRILETDLRLNSKDYRWTNIPGGPRFQVKNVAAHELGHQIGLDDLGDPHGKLTMFGRIARGEMKKTTLGRGDLRGAGRLTP